MDQRTALGNMRLSISKNLLLWATPASIYSASILIEIRLTHEETKQLAALL